MNMGRTVTMAIALVFMKVAPSLGDFTDGNFLLSTCDRTDQAGAAYCIGYIVAVADSLAEGEPVPTRDGTGVFRACVPVGATSTQVKDVAVKWLRENPRERHLGAWSLVAAAIGQAFPCR